MLTRKIPNTDINLPVLGFGAMELRNMNESDSIYLLGRVLDMGIAFIDTSPDYPGSEEFIGKAISHRRSEFLLATKCACDIWSGKGGHIYTREQFAKNLDHSLKLLRTEYIDIWQIHGPTPADLNDEFLDAIEFMREQKKAGKIGAVAVSFKNGGAGDPLYPALHSKQAFAKYLDLGFDCIQAVYGALTRDCEDEITKAAESGVGIIARGLVNRYTPEHSARAELLRDLCENGESVNDLLIRFAITHPGVTSTIVGSSNAAHMQSNVAAAEKGVLPADLYEEMKRRLA